MPNTLEVVHAVVGLALLRMDLAFEGLGLMGFIGVNRLATGPFLFCTPYGVFGPSRSWLQSTGEVGPWFSPQAFWAFSRRLMLGYRLQMTAGVLVPL